ncbi:hypothetical protein PHYSODRAFT_302460 [Phytophthora sojae]|uniref:WW domain-containing protein n=1 Tax=Phytophthora sojae (strain P6497) TaxID=1094619 RepID=G4ZP26_PHYSP|nr:hypothetical protein PHYSODRAFT_302460 [Phytophthora sojae]EGZ16103.1 hypothetical protein PHYSODRAFT_302460 [Phytophthora sojae]|eukprot:XP_009529852.1 hypothetical protein PHYSODRAFT_302460 [Phytophthora sojae]
MNSRLGARTTLQPDASKDIGMTSHTSIERVALPVLHWSNTGENDNQTAHLSQKVRAVGESRNQHTVKRWACAVDAYDEMILPHLVMKPMIPSPQKLSSPLRTRMTWNGTLRPQRDTLEFGPHLQRRASSINASLATFEATETILLAEIDSDERCASFLRQRAPRETLASFPGGSDSPQSQIHYKLRALDRKIKMNTEKPCAELGGKPSSSQLSIQGGPEQNECTAKQLDYHEDELLLSTLDASRQTKEIAATAPPKMNIASAVLVIQCLFRAFQARCRLADLLSRTYQRVLDPGTNQCFYYNRTTRLSQWEAPRLLHRCHCLLGAQQKRAPDPSIRATINDTVLDAAAKTIQTMYRQRAQRLFLKDLQLGNLEKVFDTGFGAWYYFNSRTNRSFWENVHHVRLTASNSAIYHRHQPWQTT